MSQSTSAGKQDELGRLPDWLRNMEGADKMPEWLRQLAQIEDEGWGAASQVAGEETTQAGWPGDFRESAAQADEFSEEEIEVPEWFADVEEEATEPAATVGDLALESESPTWPADFAGPEVTPETEVELPEWLRGIEATAASAVPPQQPFEEELPMPDWLSGLEVPAPSSTSQAVQSIPEPEAELPDWLRSAAETPQEAEPEAAELPDWLRPAAEAPQEAEPEAAELPDWLRPAAEAPQEAEPEVAELPDWLRPAVEAPQESASEETLELPDWLAAEIPQEPQAGEAAELPDWLAQTAETPEVSAEVETDSVATQPDWLRDLGEMPSESGVRVIGTDWLRKIEETPLPEEPLGEQEAEAVPTPDWLGAIDWNEPDQKRREPPSTDLPDWLSQVEEEMPAEGAQEALEHILPFAGPMGEEISPELSELEQEIRLIAAETGLRPGGGDLERWIDKQRTQTQPVSDLTLPVETSGPLAGLRGLLTPEPLLGLFPKSVYRPAQPAPEAHVAAARLFETILSASPAGPTVVERTQAKEVLAGLGRWLIYLSLLAVMIMAAFVPKPFNELIRAPEMLETSSFYAAVERLPQDGIVLLALDYDAALDGELTPQVQAIVHHLAQRGIGIFTVSLTPQGSLIIEDVFAQEGGLTAGEDYVNLGYLPPHPASLQALIGRPLDAPAVGTSVKLTETPLGARVTGFGEFDLIITVSGSADHVRWWVEQVGSRYGIDVVAGVSAAVAPYLLPYYQGDYGQIKGLLIGLAGAADYERRLVGETPLDYAQRNLVLQGYGQLLLVVILLLSGITFVLKRRA